MGGLVEHDSQSHAARSCEGIQRELERFVSEVGDAGNWRQSREHLSGCGECRERYRELLASADRLGGERRRSRLALAPRDERARRELLDAEKYRYRRLFIRMALIPGVALFFLGRLAPLSESGTVHALEGECTLASRAIAAPAGPEPVRRGDCLETGERAARLERESGGCIELAPRTRACVEDARMKRLLLLEGVLTVDGPCTVTARIGSAEIVDGTARVAFDG